MPSDKIGVFEQPQHRCGDLFRGAVRANGARASNPCLAASEVP
ncbi:hypothetical protein AF72_10760 [Xylella taiwanensis]|uniref:Uncharacterized protein n=1 Tax=Xylella taiwanensis TaxID=1444770 RepID=Z9JG97_9GAMM|nr:hypothetical protein AF72_10760 [Xylella taiwanensis]